MRSTGFIICGESEPWLFDIFLGAFSIQIGTFDISIGLENSIRTAERKMASPNRSFSASGGHRSVSMTSCDGVKQFRESAKLNLLILFLHRDACTVQQDSKSHEMHSQIGWKIRAVLLLF